MNEYWVSTYQSGGPRGSVGRVLWLSCGGVGEEWVVSQGHVVLCMCVL